MKLQTFRSGFRKDVQNHQVLSVITEISTLYDVFNTIKLPKNGADRDDKAIIDFCTSKANVHLITQSLYG
jgi:hypothetical protein